MRTVVAALEGEEFVYRGQRSGIGRDDADLRAAWQWFRRVADMLAARRHGRSTRNLTRMHETGDAEVTRGKTLCDLTHMRTYRLSTGFIRAIALQHDAPAIIERLEDMR